ncbi:hypothetical protein [Methylibium sp.]|uniref:hypothetical protein n=1 Tax=Methylibium sp. TaxID=2067992 RepID=UPI00179C46F1|nr:hypothetical protein [Methylibium sp.]MBA3588732.1 hypothetical protein [Methylibium sp.]
MLHGGALSLGTIALALLCTALQVGCSLEPGRAPRDVRTSEALLPSFAVPAVPAPSVRRADFRGVPHSDEARRIADWVVDSADHGVLPFVVVDKQQAQLHLFDTQGRLLGTAPVLLGLAKGDESVPGIGERRLADILPEERTTPAGRFNAEPGRNLDGEDIIWVDYDAAVSMHRVRASKPAERRLQRLASATPADNRISYGCINLPASFYDDVLRPAFAETRGIVYVLPETGSAQAEFGAYDVDLRAVRRAASLQPRGVGTSGSP